VKQDLKGAMVLIEHARDSVAAAAKMVHNGDEPYRKMFEASMSLLGVVGALNREMEDRATDQLIGKAIKKEVSRE
jgi:hypothetical protein